jgi:hypothetical protein
MTRREVRRVLEAAQALDALVTLATTNGDEFRCLIVLDIDDEHVKLARRDASGAAALATSFRLRLLSLTDVSLSLDWSDYMLECARLTPCVRTRQPGHYA